MNGKKAKAQRKQSQEEVRDILQGKSLMEALYGMNRDQRKQLRRMARRGGKQ